MRFLGRVLFQRPGAEHLGPSEDGVEGCAQFMRERGQKLVFHLARTATLGHVLTDDDQVFRTTLRVTRRRDTVLNPDQSTVFSVVSLFQNERRTFA